MKSLISSDAGSKIKEEFNEVKEEVLDTVLRINEVSNQLIHNDYLAIVG